MKEEKKLICKGITQMIWGYFFLHLNLYIGSINLLPNWMGYIFMILALQKLEMGNDSTLMLKPLGWVLAIWADIVWVLTVFGIEVDIYAITVFAALLDLYFHFQMFNNLASIAEEYECPQRKQLLLLRFAKAALIIIFVLPYDWETASLLSIAMIMVSFALLIWIGVVLTSMKHSLEK